MLIVCAEQARVEAELVGGLLGCPSCRAVLGPWGHARDPVLRCSVGIGCCGRDGRGAGGARGRTCWFRIWRCCGAGMRSR
jgi:hypothetical protein